MSDDQSLAWRDYEQHICEKLKEWAGDDAEVLFNQTLPGHRSGVDRQIDVLVKGRFAGTVDLTVAVDCKYYTRNVHVKAVEEFIGLVEDVETDLGLLVTNKGFSPAALARPTRGIKLRVMVEDIDRLPPVHRPSWDESWYESDYYEIEYGSDATGVKIEYSYIDPSALEYSFDPDNPPDRMWDPVLSGTTEEISWGDEEGRARVVDAILRHRNDGTTPDPEAIETVVQELTVHWKDGYPWVLYVKQLADHGF